MDNFNLVPQEKVKKTVLLNRIFQAYLHVLSDYPNIYRPFVLMIFFKYINFLALLLHEKFTFLWNFSLFLTFRKHLNYLNLEFYARNNDKGINHIFLYCFFFLILLYFLFMFLLIFSEKAQQKMPRVLLTGYVFFFSIILCTGCGHFIYFIIFSHIICQNPVYSDPNFTSGIGLLHFIIACLCLLLFLALNSLSILFLHLDNPFIKFVFSGSLKIFLVIFELEKLSYAIYFLIDVDNTIEQQFLLLLLSLGGAKIYFRFNQRIFYNN